MNAVSVTTLTALYASALRPSFRRNFPRRASGKSSKIIKITSFGSVATMLSMLLAKNEDSKFENENPKSKIQNPKSEFASFRNVRLGAGSGGSFA